MITDAFNLFVDGKDQEFLIKSPTLADQREAQKVYNQAFSDAVKSGCIVRARMDDLLKEQGLWDDSKQQKLNTLQQQLMDNEKTLAKGGISIKTAREVAITMRKIREEIRELISVRTNLDNHTAEGQADNARFNYLIASCLVYSMTKEKYFKNYEEYLARAAESVAIKAAQVLANMLYGLDNDYEKKLPENKFLIKYKFVNDNLRFINKEGRLVDSEGRLIDSEGRFINSEDKYVDKDGNLVDENGDYITDFKPFFDDDGKPILEDTGEIKTNEQPISVNNEDKPTENPSVTNS
jgi:hypothetical protein